MGLGFGWGTLRTGSGKGGEEHGDGGEVACELHFCGLDGFGGLDGWWWRRGCEIGCCGLDPSLMVYILYRPVRYECWDVEIIFENWTTERARIAVVSST